MRVVACILLLLTVSLTGCQSLFGKRSNNAHSTSLPGDKKPAPFPGNSDSIVKNDKNKIPDAEVGGLLAGYVIDEYNSRPENTFIRWVCVDEPQDHQAPIDVAVNPQGYFTIRGLKKDHNYKLVARSKNGEKMIAGITYTRTPDIHVLIKMSEALASAEIPEIPGSPALADSSKSATPLADNKPKIEEPSKEVPASATAPAWDAVGSDLTVKPQAVFPSESNAPDLKIPGQPPKIDTLHSPPPPSFPDLPPTQTAPSGESPGWVPGIARQQNAWPPVMNVPPTRPDTGPEIRPDVRIQRPTPLDSAESSLPSVTPITPVDHSLPPPPPMAAAPVSPPTPAAYVPSCVLLGQRLVNFALYDLNNQPWEFRTHRRGKLTLIDFWGTACAPCIESMPNLRKLHSGYASSGLEIVGISYDNSPNPQMKVQRIRQLSQKLQLNYTQLVGAGADCPVSNQFNITGIPTLVLVDENGWIIWRHVGMLDAYRYQELELLVRQRLEMHVSRYGQN